jgi:ABC-type polysaccharide/polyol phosphate export permease
MANTRVVRTFNTSVEMVGSDFMEGLRGWRLWTRMGWHDMLLRYRRSWLGPVWLILTLAIFIGALSIVYSTLFQIDTAEFLPFVAVGIVVWSFISAVSSESVLTFIESENYIRTIRISFFIYVLRVFWRNVLTFTLQMAFVLPLLVIFGKLSILGFPLALLGIAILFAQGLWVIPLLALLGTRFRDLFHVIQSLLQVLFFVTPVFWLPSLLGNRRWIADINPMNSLINLVRSPLLGYPIHLSDYLFVLVFTCLGAVTMVLFYARFRSRIVYWL